MPPLPLRPLLRPVWWWALFALWVISISALSSFSTLPPAPVHPGFLEMDKLVHAAAYCIGGMFLTAALHLQFFWPAWKTGAASLYWLTLHGFIDEIHQGFVPNRTGLDAGDLLADVTGAALGVGLTLLLYAGTRPKTGSPAGR